MKTIYYTSIYTGSGIWQITYWDKGLLDRSNAVTERFVTIDEAKIRNRIEAVLGIRKFNLEKVKV